MTDTNIRQGYVLPVDPLNELGDPEPIFKIPAQLQFIRTFISIIRTQFAKFVSKDTATPYIYLQSPGGKTFKLSVSDDGALVVVNARG